MQDEAREERHRDDRREGREAGKERRERDGPGVRRDGPRLARRGGPGSGQGREEKDQKSLAEGMFLPRF